MLAFGVIIADQVTKYLIRTFFTSSQQITLIPHVLSLTYITNTGASFGILKGMNTALIIVGLCIIAFILYHVIQEQKKDSNTSSFFPFALIIGGALSNIGDRIMYGFVADFIQVPFWPAFNVADSFITLGVISLIVNSFRNKKFM